MFFSSLSRFLNFWVIALTQQNTEMNWWVQKYLLCSKCRRKQFSLLPISMMLGLGVSYLFLSYFKSFLHFLIFVSGYWIFSNTLYFTEIILLLCPLLTLLIECITWIVFWVLSLFGFLVRYPTWSWLYNPLPLFFFWIEFPYIFLGVMYLYSWSCWSISTGFVIRLMLTS